jgi:hypothetical protein
MADSEAPKTRYSTTLANLDQQLARLPAADLQKIKAAFRDQATQTVKDGEAGEPPVIDGRKFNVAKFTAAFPAGLSSAAEKFVERTQEEAAYRGPTWVRLSLMDALYEYLPSLQTPDPPAAPTTPATPEQPAQ